MVCGGAGLAMLNIIIIIKDDSPIQSFFFFKDNTGFFGPE